MPERLNQRLTKPITVDLVVPGHTRPASPVDPRAIGEQEVISSYLLVSKPENSRYRDLRALSGSVSFQQPIPVPPDSLRISDDGRQLCFNLFVGAHSYPIRVLVKENN
jgi:hypothetical protein